ncbi:MAG: alpha/beta fold hydrolase [Clostridia bacterium]|nr:alpha/beta fold hydrolase [Clostridia bacterium]
MIYVGAIGAPFREVNMQGYIIALIVIAGVIAVVAVALLVGMLVSVHCVLGRRTKYADKPNFPDTEKYAVDYKWLDDLKSQTDNLAINGYDGVRLVATRIKHHEGNDKIAVCCHGYGATFRGMQRHARLFFDRGFDVVLPTMRGHGGSGGKVGMAWIDRFDLSRWVDLLVDKYGKHAQIALLGVSMGGATVVGVAGMTPPKQVKFVVDDCGFSSQSEQYLYTVRNSRIKPLATFVFNSGVKLIHGYNPADADFTQFARKMTVPALFVHGAVDRVVPVDHCKKLFEACSSQDKRLLTVDAADHTFALAVDETAYTAAVDSLIDKYIVDADPRPEKPPEPVEEAASEPTESDTAVQSEGEARPTEQPAADAPKEEQPVTEAPKEEQPAAEAQPTEQPVTEAPQEKPASEQSVESDGDKGELDD